MSGPATATRGALAVEFARFADLKVPHRPADVDHARDPTPQLASESVVEMRFDPRDLFLVGSDTGQIDHIRPGENIGGLEEVNMCIDVTRENELPAAINPPNLRRKLNVVSRSDGGNSIAIRQQHRVGDRLAVGWINDSGTAERDFLRSNIR